MELNIIHLHVSEFYQKHKWLTVVEISIAVFMLIANLLGYLPFTSTIYVFIYAWLSLRFRKKGWKHIGLRKPERWSKTILIALSVGILYQLLSLYAIEPLLSKLTGELPDVSLFRSLVGNLNLLLFWIAISWSLAAFGEEMVYRGYFMNRIRGLFENEKTGWLLALLLSSVLFGGVHLYQGISGMISVGLFGVVFAAVYFASGKNLWASILAHGISDTLGFVMIYYGVYPGI